MLEQQLRQFKSENFGKVSFQKGKYKYEPSERYKKFLAEKQEKEKIIMERAQLRHVLHIMKNHLDCNNQGERALNNALKKVAYSL